MRRILIFVSILVLSAQQIAIAAPKNVILLIGDGMGMAEIAMARNYQFDGGSGLFVDTMDFHGTAIVNALRESDPNLIAFVGDSASGGTVLATGQRTAVRRIATTAKYDAPIETILELAKKQSLNTGLVTTAVITDATPASFAAHVTNRYCMKPGDAPCYGDISIIEQMIDLDIDILLGGGERLLPAVRDGKTIEQVAIDKGYTLFKDRNELLSLNTDNDNEKLWGIFSDYHMPVEWQGHEGRMPKKLEAEGGVLGFFKDDNNVIFPEARACEINPNHDEIPKLEEMTNAALNKLTAKSKTNEKGFFLMIEGASIDKQSHAANPCGVIGEMLAFDRTIEMVTEFAKEHGDTLVIVTADHGGSSQTIHHPYYENYKRTEENVPGLYEMLLTTGGNELSVYYGTNNIGDQAHTGINVPVYSHGLPKDNPLRGTIRQTDIFGVMKRYLLE